MHRQFFAAFAMALCFGGSAGATSVRELMLDDIVGTATVAFQGTCIANRTERDAQTNLVVTLTTFVVEEVLKGNVQRTHIIKQIGGKMPDGEMSLRVDGIPTFVVGEEYVVFLAGVSAAGFSSPIGLAQGKFTIKRDSFGQHVSNGRDFRDMLPAARRVIPLPESTQLLRDFDLSEFKQLTRARVMNMP